MAERTIIVPPPASLAGISAHADEYSRATRLHRYQEGLRDLTLIRQKRDLQLFAEFLRAAGANPGDLFHNLAAWHGVTAGLLDAFVQWQKREGYAVGSINVRLATVRAYCQLAFDVGILDRDTITAIKGVKGIQHKQARNVDARREKTRRGYKKALAVDIPDEALPLLKRPDTGQLAARDALLMCLLLDHGLRVSEIALLQGDDISLRSRLLTYYRPKVDIVQKDRLTDDTYEAARRYLPMLADKHGSLFGLAITSIQERVRKIGELAGIKGLSPHDCRHSWATRAARHGTPLERLKQAGGWSNLAMPLRYVKDSEIANEGVKLS